MSLHYPDLGSASDWLKQISTRYDQLEALLQFWVVTRHQYGISELVSQTFFHGKTSGGVVECRLFPQASLGTELKPVFSP